MAVLIDRSISSETWVPFASLVGEHPAWWERARCRNPKLVPDISIFFPVKSGHGDEAKACCAQCPVRQECLDRFLREEAGVFGGLSGEQRRRLRTGKPVNRGRYTPLPGERIIEIRERYAQGGVSYPQLAAEYGVSKTTIQRSVRGRR